MFALRTLGQQSCRVAPMALGELASPNVDLHRSRSALYSGQLRAAAPQRDSLLARSSLRRASISSEVAGPDVVFFDRFLWGLFGFFGSAAIVTAVAKKVSTYVEREDDPNRYGVVYKKAQTVANKAHTIANKAHTIVNKVSAYITGEEQEEQEQEPLQEAEEVAAIVPHATVQDPLHPSVLSPERIYELAAGLSIAPGFFAALIGPKAVFRALKNRSTSAPLRAILRVALGTQILTALTYCGLVVGKSMYEMTTASPSLTEKMKSELDQRFGTFNPLLEELERVQGTLSAEEQPAELASLGLRLWLLSSSVTLLATWWVPLLSIPATGFFATFASFRMQRRLKLTH